MDRAYGYRHVPFWSTRQHHGVVWWLKESLYFYGIVWTMATVSRYLCFWALAFQSPSYQVTIAVNNAGEAYPEIALALVGVPAAIYALWRLLR